MFPRINGLLLSDTAPLVVKFTVREHVDIGGDARGARGDLRQEDAEQRLGDDLHHRGQDVQPFGVVHEEHRGDGEGREVDGHPGGVEGLVVRRGGPEEVAAFDLESR